MEDLECFCCESTSRLKCREVGEKRGSKSTLPAAEIEHDKRFHRLLAVPFFFFQCLLSQFACVKYQKETIILQRQNKNNNNQERNSPYAKKKKLEGNAEYRWQPRQSRLSESNPSWQPNAGSHRGGKLKLL